MVKLKDLLRDHSWQMLRAIAYAHTQEFDAQWNKSKALEHIVAFLAAPAYLNQLLRGLDAQATLALRTLNLAGGSLPQPIFEAQFGSIRPYRPWRKNSPQAPWRQPSSTADYLYYMGLIFLQTRASIDVVVIPDDVANLLPDLNAEEPSGIHVSSTENHDLILDLAHILTYLQGHAVIPLAGRWLAPRHLRALTPLLTQHDPAAAAARSELQTGYLRFIHYLAEVAGLVAPALGVLLPTPEAFAWLEAGELERYQSLGQGWDRDLRTPNPDACRWTRYRFPGPPAGVAAIFDLLASLPPGRYTRLDLRQDIQARAIGAGLDLAGDADQTWINALFVGPFTWANWIRSTSTDDLIWTPLGAAWLAPDEVDASTTPVPDPLKAPARITSVEEHALTFTLPEPPAHPPLRALVDLGLPAPEDDATPIPAPHPQRQRHLSRRLFARLRSQGRPQTWIIERVQALTGDAASQAAYQQLAIWEREVTQITLQRHTILTVHDPEIRDALLAKRTLREDVVTTISRRHLVIQPHRVEHLLRVLRKTGYTPLVDPGAQAIGSGTHPATAYPIDDPDNTITLDRDAVAHLWMALRALSGLGDLVRLPVTPSPALLDALGATLGARIDGLEALAAQLDGALRDALDGYAAFPATIPGLDTPAILTTLRQALEKQQPVEIVYHTAGRNERTTRVVEPLRLATRGGADYLTAYCRLRQAERVFRVDRIERADPLSSTYH